MKIKQSLVLVIVSVLSALFSVGIFNYFGNENLSKTQIVSPNSTARFVDYDAITHNTAFDFTLAAAHATPAVVHIKTTAFPHQTSQQSRSYQHPFFGDDFFRFWGDRGWQGQAQPQVASGSGVIVSPNGYIVTNNHVINNADEIEVIFNDNSSLKAKLVGSDPSTDIALIKVEAEQLAFLNFTNSDSVKIGEWVLAVGNPFNLSSTVTAGIVSAKARNINILKEAAAVESFIQTDAAVNPGNSGGALVNLSGELIGINTAIASPTGAFAGYSFAVPANIVKKVVADIKEFGIVQRGFLGISIQNVNQQIAKEYNLSDYSGVFIESINDGSAADDAGMKSGDVIKAINGKKVNSAPELQEIIAQFRPGDKVKVDFIREGKTKTTDLVLKNKNLSTELISKDITNSLSLLGAEFIALNEKEKKELGLTHGIKVNKITSGKLSSQTNMREGFIITFVDKTPIKKVDDLAKAMEGKKGGVMIEGIYPNYPGTYYYAFGM